MKIRLKEILKAKGIRPEEFSKMMGCTMATVYNMQSEVTSVSIKQIKKMAELLDIPEWELIYSPEELL